MDTGPIELDSAAMRVDPTPGQATETAHRLLDAAASLIWDRGIERLTTTDVAARARVSVGTVYRYFEDREALIRTLYERNVMRMRDALVDAAVTSHGSLAADVRALLDTYVRMHRTIPAYQPVRAWQWLLPEARADRAIAVEAAARDLVAVLAPRHGVVLTPARRTELVAAIQRTDAIVLAAFLDDPGMDDEAIAQLGAIVESMLTQAIREAIEG
ncbi:TetR/AcrR family transcriptional regulator [Agrococcus jejuensis]|uniref:DNA-binding transcriptional regulator, AcrR family n=1 Tax=Agrococcus jejuensis TaxID=399736 RepID=A0A1G8DWG6_9MICO|nr:TetR/AcrR family transcriptional regulator [Agrococcus jejuensis]SDH61935.1 DNA-binding transcriptional regulator, AcrR family [Agrococcus jejuensis]